MLRGLAGRPAACATAIRSLTDLYEPYDEPAIREMVSSMSVPPRSLAPERSISAAPSVPSFTQLVWMLGMCGCSSSRAMAVTARLSRMVGPGRAIPARYTGALVCTNGSVTNSVKPPVRCWMSARVRRCPSQWRGWSTWPYIIVEDDRMPSSWAVVTTSIQSAAGSLPLVRIQRTSSSRISAAVPGMVSSPASLAAVSHSRIDMPVRAAPLTTSIGEKACTCMPGTRAFTARAMSK